MVTERTRETRDPHDQEAIEMADLADRLFNRGRHKHWGEVLFIPGRQLRSINVGWTSIARVNAFRGRLTELSATIHPDQEKHVELLTIGQTHYQKKVLRIEGLAVPLLDPISALLMEPLMKRARIPRQGEGVMSSLGEDIGFLNFYFRLGLRLVEVGEDSISLEVPETVLVSGPTHIFTNKAKKF